MKNISCIVQTEHMTAHDLYALDTDLSLCVV